MRSKYSGSSDSARDKRGGGGGGGGGGREGVERGSSKGLCDLKDVEIKTRLCEEVAARSHKEVNYRKFLGQSVFTC